MGLTALRRETVFWLAVLGTAGVLVWLLRDVLLPFVLGMAIGYFLDPVVERLERRGLPRSVAAGALILSLFAAGILALVLLLPSLIEQAIAFVHQLPGLLAALQERVRPLAARVLTTMRATPAGDLTGPATDAARKLLGAGAFVLGDLMSRGLALVNLLSLLAVTPLVAFYLLRDWPRIVAEIDGWLPRPHAATIRDQARAIDDVLAGFARGSAIVCAVLATFYALALSLVGLDFGLVIGLTAGTVSFVPYLGFLVGLVSSVGVALYQFWPAWSRVLAVLGIFLAGQILTDYVLTPRLVGNRVGLHPLWVVFAVFAGGALFGFVGVLLAVPASAAIGVLTRFAIARYKASALYHGTGQP